MDVSVARRSPGGRLLDEGHGIGAYESSMSTQNWNVAKDPSGNPTTFTLVVGNRNYSITPADNSSKALVDTINANYGNLVHATTVNVSPGDTRISCSADIGQTDLDLLQVPTAAVPISLQQQAPAGYAISQTTATWDSCGSPSSYTLVVGGDNMTFACKQQRERCRGRNQSGLRFGRFALRWSISDRLRPRLPNSAGEYDRGAHEGSTILDLKIRRRVPYNTADGRDQHHGRCLELRRRTPQGAAARIPWSPVTTTHLHPDRQQRGLDRRAINSDLRHAGTCLGGGSEAGGNPDKRISCKARSAMPSPSNSEDFGYAFPERTDRGRAGGL